MIGNLMALKGSVKRYHYMNWEIGLKPFSKVACWAEP
jgi:hypothetical protein